MFRPKAVSYSEVIRSGWWGGVVLWCSDTLRPRDAIGPVCFHRTMLQVIPIPSQRLHSATIVRWRGGALLVHKSLSSDQLSAARGFTTTATGELVADCRCGVQLGIFICDLVLSDLVYVM